MWDIEFTDEFEAWWDSLDAVPEADRLYDEHLRQLREEGWL